MARRPARDVPVYLDTPLGLVTPAGTRFHTTEASLRAYAGPVLDRVPLAALVRDAEAWLQAPTTLALWALPLLLAGLPAGAALGAAVALYAVWAVFTPAYPVRPLLPALRLMQLPAVQAALYVVSLSAYGIGGRPWAAIAGMAGFIVFRLGLAAAALRPALGPLWGRLYPLPLPDQVLRALIVRTALALGLPLPGLDALDASVREALTRLRRPR